ncbi:hypothetical protein RJT34_28570 [Clitoria ternatea]|uniref:Uncharacterized protein n=1 Tax=Clitoria ternatea TaxID=43366 RepID=A0AAN9F910_CLITE
MGTENGDGENKDTLAWEVRYYPSLIKCHLNLLLQFKKVVKHDCSYEESWDYIDEILHCRLQFLTVAGMASFQDEFKSWIEVAPPLLEFPKKPSNTPKLETILEDRDAEEADDLTHL